MENEVILGDVVRTRESKSLRRAVYRFRRTFQLKKYTDWGFIQIDLQVFGPTLCSPEGEGGAELFIAKPWPKAHRMKYARYRFMIVNLSLVLVHYLVGGLRSRRRNAFPRFG